MGNENLVIVYWNDIIKGSVRLYGSSNISDMNEFAKKMVPEGIHYNIVHKKDVADLALPPLVREPLSSEGVTVENLFYEYFEAL
jgi:hypothetical protein